MRLNHKVGAFSLVVSVAAAFALSACGGGEFEPSNDCEQSFSHHHFEKKQSRSVG